MPFYQKRGQLPNKRHIQFRNKDGILYYEELISREGFSSLYSNVYHLNRPTDVTNIGKLHILDRKAWIDTHRHHHIKTFNLEYPRDPIGSRISLFYNNDVELHTAHVKNSMKDFYRNGHHDEVIFIHNGKGVLHTNFGNLKLIKGDYVVIPRGVIWQMTVLEPMRQFIIETKGPIETPVKYRNRYGQLLEHAPYSERDIRAPEFTDPQVNGPVTVNVKLVNGYQVYDYANHPCDLVGWDGFYYPWVFNINDFMPITGKIHQPPPVHQTFQAPGLVICSFVPRLFDYHPEAIPAPYAHSNVDSDEILYYAGGEFMSRKGIQEGSITFHPAGIPHGPQPGKIEESIGKKNTNELAVMVDTFRPLTITAAARAADDKNYPLSWKQ